MREPWDVLPLALILLLATFPSQDPVPRPATPAEVADAREARLRACTELAERFCAALREDKRLQLQGCLALDVLFDRVTHDVDTPAAFRKGFISEGRPSLVQTLLKSVHEPLEQGGDLRLLRVREREGQLRPLLRLVHPEGALTYLELDVGDDAKGRLRIRDWYSFAAGQWASETMRHAYLPLAENQSRGVLERLFGREKLLVSHWPDVVKLVECLTKKDLEAGMAIYNRLPEELQRDKFVMIQRLGLVSLDTDHPEYQRALEDLHKYFPDDPAFVLHSIDFHVLRKEFDLACAAVGKLRDALGGDPYLDLMEGNLLLEAEKPAAAREKIERSIAAEPERLDAHWLLVKACMQLHDHAALLAQLERMDAAFELQWADLTQVDEYKEFAATPQHAEWLAYLAAKK